ncbi:ricin-type beta-trefoil lectin domain protein [Streptomyces sp. NPDC055055]
MLLALLPTQSWAQPPDPDASTDAVAREPLVLEGLPEGRFATGRTYDANLERIDAPAPANLEQPPAGTATRPPAAFGTVDFGSAVQPAAFAIPAADPAPVPPTPVGSLPVKLGQSDGAPAPTGTWQVDVASPTAAVSDGVDGTVLTVTAPSTGSVPVSVQLGYEAFQNLNGAGWAGRLRLVQFPECYATTPDIESCRQYEELETVNDPVTRTLTATVDTAADGTTVPAVAPQYAASGPGIMQAGYVQTAAAGGDRAVVGAIDSGSGEGGSFKATPLSGNGKWAAGSSSGAFSWTYPIDVPPTPAGPSPKIAFSYNSQAVDGRTAVSSPQASWIGEGWEYDPGHIERRYRTCKDDIKATAAGTPNNTAKKDQTSDLCWVSHNAVMSLNGTTSELVRVGTTDTYKLQDDDGTRVQLKTGGDNGDNDGEYWIVTTAEGTKYYYGLNKIGGGHADTDSVFTVPVFGNHPGEPCYAAAFAASRCNNDTKKQQAWHWGLDKVVDVHGNAMVVDWARSINYYAVNKKFKTPESYYRGGIPDSIEYGLRDDNLGGTPAAKVDFLHAQRCVAAGTACDSANFDNTKDPAAYRPWWDTPGNLNCKSDSKLCPAFPSFWLRMRLSAVATYATRPGTTGLVKVDQYALRHSFPRDWYSTSPGMWLNSIARYAYTPGATSGTVLSKVGVSFEPYTVGPGEPLSGYLKDKQLPNLVRKDGKDQRPGFTRPRIGTVRTEHGGQIDVVYRGGCQYQPSVAPEDNHNTCFPTRWSPDGEEKKPALAWFNKYVVDSVTESDRITGVSDRVTTSYAYSGAAWGKSDDEFSKPDLRTYSEWRGFQQVAVSQGRKVSTTPQTRSYAVTRYFRGAGGAVKDSTGKETLVADDQQQYSGMPAETITYDGAGGRIVGRTLNFPVSVQIASRDRDGGVGPLTAYRTRIARTDSIKTVGSSWQAVRTTSKVDATYGLPTSVETAVVKPNGTGETLGNYTCTVKQYVHNPDLNLIGLPSKVRKTATSCADYATGTGANRLLISAVANYYDGLPFESAPVRGLVTANAESNGTGDHYSVVTHTTYDPLGRVRTVKQPVVGTTETQYTPGDTGGPVTSVKKINPKGHTSVTTYDPGRGLPLTVTDTNGHTTRTEYDVFGRLVKGWSASRSSGTQTPDVIIDYRVAEVTPTETKPTSVTVRTLKDDGVTYSSQVSIYDGLMRAVQTQREAHGPGRIVMDTHYDDHGRVSEQTSSYLAKGEPTAALFQRVSDTLVPSSVRTAYDGLGRVVRKTSLQEGRAVASDVTEYGDDWTIARPGGGAAPAVRTVTDALGRTVRVDHSTDKAQTKWRSTSYGYDARGNRTEVKDAANNVWSYTFDTRGRLESSVDPDIGTGSYTYDDFDRQISATGPKGTTYTEYDVLGRVVAVRQGSATAAPVKEFTFDMPGALGKPVSSVRHDATGDYVSRVTGYDIEYRPTGREVVIPQNSLTTGVAGTYTYGFTYTNSGKVLTATLPAAGGLAAEKLITRYDGDGLAQSTSGQSWYTTDVTYSAFGEPLRTVSGAQPNRVWTTNFVDESSGRLQRTVWDRETPDAHRISGTYLSYDQAGHLTSAARKEVDGTAESWDNQCFTYDYMGELVHAWTSGLAAGKAGCKSSSGTTWGYQADGGNSGGPVADAPSALTDGTAPGSQLTASITAAGPASGTVTPNRGGYWQSFTFDVAGNRASMTEHDLASPAADDKRTYSYGVTIPGNGATPPVSTQPHALTGVDRATGTDSSFVFEAGNQTRRTVPGGSQSLTWNEENKLTSVSGFGDGEGAIIGVGGRCLDLEAGASADGTAVQIYPCHNQGPQKWSTTGDTLRIKGKCAVVNVNLVQLGACDGTAAQKFTVRADKSIYHVASGRCLYVPGTTDANSTNLAVGNCHPTDADQQWTVADRETYVYDAEGNRLLQNSAGGTVLYIGETELSTDPNGKVIRAARTYSQRGAPSVVRVSTNGATTNHKLTALLGDAVGTATTSVELTAGQAVTRRQFKPFGETRGTKPNSWVNKRSYLGTGIDDSATGLTHLGAREYDQATGRFLSADPLIDFTDPLQANGYAYADNNPISKSDPDGLIPIECWEGIATCSNGKIVTATPPAVVNPSLALTEGKIQGKTVIYNDRGVPLTVRQTNPGAKPSEQVAFQYMNDDLRNGGQYYDPKTGNGSQYLWGDEDDAVIKQKKALMHDANGNHVAVGTTTDIVKVTWKDGKIVSVESWDATDSTRDFATHPTAADDTEKTIKNKMDPEGKGQSPNVVFVAKDFEQAEAIRDRFVGNANVRVIYPGGTFDTHRVAPLVRKLPDGRTVTTLPGENQALAKQMLEDLPASSGGGRGRSGGSRLGKIFGAAGILGDLLFIYEGIKMVNDGCDGGITTPCGPPPTA